MIKFGGSEMVEFSSGEKSVSQCRLGASNKWTDSFLIIAVRSNFRCNI